jgi:hypothetical protein
LYCGNGTASRPNAGRQSVLRRASTTRPDFGRPCHSVFFGWARLFARGIADDIGSFSEDRVSDRVVAIRVGAASFVDEGGTRALDTFREKARVNALFLASPTRTRGTGGRRLPNQPLPDHGAQGQDPAWVGGNYATAHPHYDGGPMLGPAGRAPEHPDLDLFAAVIPEAKQRGMRSVAWIEESSYAAELRRYPNFPKCLEVDARGRPAPRFCFNDPDYRTWHPSSVEDDAKSDDLDGIAWCSERPGPLNLLMHGPVRPEQVSCFCSHGQRIARDRAIDARRAVEGYRRALDWNAKVAGGESPRDGAFVSFWRLLVRYPELLAWRSLRTDSPHQLSRDIHGLAKARRPDIQVGWHVYHNISFSPFYRADQGYAELGRYSDFLKIVIDTNCAGPRFHAWVANSCKSRFADASPAEAYPSLFKLLQLDESPDVALPTTGFSADEVRRETARRRRGGRGHQDRPRYRRGHPDRARRHHVRPRGG